MPNHPTVHRRSIEAWDAILLRVIQIQGPEILTEIVRRKVAGSEAPEPKFKPQDIVDKLQALGAQWRSRGVGSLSAGAAATGQWAQEVRARAPGVLAEQAQHLKSRLSALGAGVRQLRHGPHRREPLEKAALETLTMMGFCGGVLFGVQLPQIDLRLSAKGQDKDALILHAAALMATEVAAEWVQEVLRRTLLAPGLGDGEKRYLRAISKVLAAGTLGVQKGWNARQVAALWVRFWRSPIAKQHRVATDARAVRIAQEVIERLRR